MIIAICGKSGAGKTTLREQLLQHDKSLEKAMSYTTRPIRDGEKSGDDYFFIDEKAYHNDYNFIITRKAGDYLYGTSKEVLDMKNPVFIIDIGGMKQLSQYAEFKVVFINPDIDVLKDRLLKRGDKEADIDKRLEIDKEFTFENIKKIAGANNILQIKNETANEVFQKTLNFIKNEKNNLPYSKEYEKIRD